MADPLVQEEQTPAAHEDNITDKAFIMRAALMWTVNDLPTYGMESEWSTTGIMGCLVCMNDTWAFHLQHGRKRLNAIPKVVYTLMKEQKKRICEWIRGLKFPDGYASSIARCVDMTELRMHDMKNHDSNIFMLKLIPVVFHEMLLDHMWSPLTE
ncbi:UNVERIFIED_CONTAM: hypothetical protein Scaly_0261600 [Sesamum calycinum]|uniref:Uncharacterized protein n=1 Tax=Sesamum calycinum TaxID=2727403 RepID=A0AAW2S959_9LAMI